MYKDVFAPNGIKVDIPTRVISVLKKLKDGLTVNNKRLTGKEMNIVGLCYWYGHIVPLDYVEAVKWYMTAAGKRCNRAEHNLFTCYSQGTGVSPNIEDALYWLKRSAKHNDAAAQEILGEYYYDGEYIKRNRRYAKIWFEKSLKNAFNNEDPVILNDLGAKYYQGEYGFLEDRSMAIKCWEKAAEKGLYLPIAWLINNYIDESNIVKVEYWMKKYNNCVQKEPQITKVLMRKYEIMISLYENE
jgi:TPR repeat protein